MRAYCFLSMPSKQMPQRVGMSTLICHYTLSKPEVLARLKLVTISKYGGSCTPGYLC